MREAVIVEALRTPVGRRKGALSEVHPTTLLGDLLKAVVERTGIDPARVDDVIGGCGSQVGEQAVNVTRNAWLGAGLPESVPGTTVDRQCGSSQQAAHFAAQGVMSGAYDMVIACGVESMTRVPMGSSMAGQDPFGPGIPARYPGGFVHQGISAELIAAKWGIDREECDALAAESHRRAAAAIASGAFRDEIVPVNVNGVTFDTDEGVRPDTTVETLAALKPAFYDERAAEARPDIPWVVTAGNSSQISDGASALLIMTPERAKELGLTPRWRFHTFAVAAGDPILMLTAPIPATTRVMERAGLSLADMDQVEMNEAFASVVLAWRREHKVDDDRLNPRGGAIALGHPIGGSGGRIMTTLLHGLEQTGGRYGLQTMCEGGGMANATVIERLG